MAELEAAIDKLEGRDFNCFVCCISTHGDDRGNLLSYDDDYSVQQVVELMASKCHILRDRPRILIIDVSS